MTTYASGSELQVLTQKTTRAETGRGKQTVHCRKRREIRRLLLLILVTAAIFLSGFFFGNRVNHSVSTNATAASETEVSYQTIRVTRGDTLWTIAEEYMDPTCTSREEFIEEVMEINNVQDGVIHAGSYLIIPVYRTL